MKRKEQVTFQEKKAKFIKDFLIVIEILIRVALALVLALLSVKVCVQIAASLTNVANIRIFLINSFLANLLFILLPFFAFLCTMLIIRPMPLGRPKTVKVKKSRKTIRLERRLLIISYLLALISFLYSGNSYVAITDDKIYVSSLENCFVRKDYAFASIDGVKIRGKRGKSGASIKFFIQLKGEEIDIWPGGFYDRANIETNVRRVYQALKERGVPLDVDLSYLNERQIRQIQRILE